MRAEVFFIHTRGCSRGRRYAALPREMGFAVPANITDEPQLSENIYAGRIDVVVVLGLEKRC